MTGGMTIKQWHRSQYLACCAAIRDVVDTKPLDKRAFIRLSLAIQSHKGHVPRRLWSMANAHMKRRREAVDALHAR